MSSNPLARLRPPVVLPATRRHRAALGPVLFALQESDRACVDNPSSDSEVFTVAVQLSPECESKSSEAMLLHVELEHATRWIEPAIGGQVRLVCAC